MFISQLFICFGKTILTMFLVQFWYKEIKTVQSWKRLILIPLSFCLMKIRLYLRAIKLQFIVDKTVCITGIVVENLHLWRPQEMGWSGNLSRLSRVCGFYCFSATYLQFTSANGGWGDGNMTCRYSPVHT